MTFPAYEGEGDTVFWDGSRFRNQFGQFVSTLDGINTLVASTAEGNVVWYDQRGNEVPDPAELLYKTMTFDYGTVVRTWIPVTSEAYDNKSDPGSYYVTLALYRDDDGNLRTVTVYNKVGERIKFEDEQRKIAGAIAEAEGIAVGAEGSDTVLERSVRLIHYMAK